MPPKILRVQGNFRVLNFHMLEDGLLEGFGVDAHFAHDDDYTQRVITKVKAPGPSIVAHARRTPSPHLRFMNGTCGRRS